jgi:hypothetical protein
MSVRLLILKHLRNWSYEELEREVRANLVADPETPAQLDHKFVPLKRFSPVMICMEGAARARYCFQQPWYQRYRSRASPATRS